MQVVNKLRQSSARAFFMNEWMNELFIYLLTTRTADVYLYTQGKTIVTVPISVYVSAKKESKN